MYDMNKNMGSNKRGYFPTPADTPPRTAGTDETGDRLAPGQYLSPDVLSISMLDASIVQHEIVQTSIDPVTRKT